MVDTKGAGMPKRDSIDRLHGLVWDNELKNPSGLSATNLLRHGEERRPYCTDRW